VNAFKGRVQELIETPMMLNGDLLEQDLLSKDARLIHIVFKQTGIYSLQMASLQHMDRCFKGKR